MPALRTTATIGAFAVLAVLALDGVAVATTGSGLILGRVNSADRTTTLRTTTAAAPAMRFQTKAGQPPFAVTSDAQVDRLNAAAVGGHPAADLQNAVYTFALPDATSSSLLRTTFPDLPPGTYLASYAVTMSLSATTSTPVIADCAFSRASGYEIANRATAVQSYLATSASGMITVSADDPAILDCYIVGATATSVTTQPGYSQVNFLRVDAVTAGTGTDATARPHRPGTTTP